MATSVSYTVQTPGGGASILKAYRQLAIAATFDRVTGLYAFASLKGARLLTDALAESSNWSAASKRWIISIDGGITEPEALRHLIRLRRAEIRVPHAEELLARNLRPIRRFHPKTLVFERMGVASAPTAIMVGSANLTCNGLCFSHEHAISATAASRALPVGVAEGIADLETVVSSATVIDLGFVDRYEAIRPVAPALPEEFEDERADLLLQEKPVIPATIAASLAAASHFWIEVEYVVRNRGRLEEGNQIDMQRGSRVFFGFGDRSLPKNSPIGSVQIRFGDHSASRNLRFGNNAMDKLDLPIPGVEGPPSYVGKTLLFARESSTSFRLSLGTAADTASWKAKSRKAGTLFAMRSGRQFGVF